MTRRRAPAWAAVRVLVSAAVLGVLFSRFAPTEVLGVCTRADPGWLAGAFAVYLASQIVSALRWHAIARAVGFATGPAACIRAYLVGMFFGLAVPSTLGADGARTVLLGRDPPGRARALSTVVFDRLVGLATLFAVAAAALLWGPTESLPPSLTAVVAALAGAMVLAWALVPPLAALLPAGGRLRRLAEEDVGPLFRDRRLVAVVTVLSLVVHGGQIAAQKLLTDAIGVHVSWGFAAVYHPLVALAAAVPLTVGGFGFREAAYAYLLPHAGVAADDAIALGLLWWAIGAAGGLVGGVVYAVGSDSVRAR